MADVYNSVYRDKALNSNYPFDPKARQSVIPEDVLLDVSLYVPSTFKPPFFVIEVDGGVNGVAVRFVIGDKSRRFVCLADCPVDRGMAPLLDVYGRHMGILVYDTDGMEAFKGEIGSASISFVENETRLNSECARFYDPKGLHTIQADNVALTNNVAMAFAGGANLGDDGDVNVYGENADTTTPLKSINRIKSKHAFILAHVHDDYLNESAIRLETTSGSIKIGKSRDF